MAGGWVIVCIVFCHWVGENAHILLHELSHMYTYLIYMYLCIHDPAGEVYGALKWDARSLHHHADKFYNLTQARSGFPA